ncbi:YozE family protein [Pediococcus acidilactici]|uniref:YozE family protein n=1 Tax=Pediococcus acidilactici TaxID=1254 RepID=UPI00091CD55F|nr:YozE family protein [Pediococcus acidilactici]MBS9399532.1 YozE family protein [Pediococcus acidilactici]MDB8858468.1 YozE family protein [Pediococcus acidilactici]MDB8861340.1 YozE family protein [Pediococcus acidilactici]MDB8862350.1 YozE family protein [Pediococcus acidilactici]MDB8866950.1 YozE family protein [Pediococcus acidilactici]
MRKTFYQFLMTQRNPEPNDEVEEFANQAFFDQSFPKQDRDFDEISKYLELNGSYLQNMTIFDQAWQRYLESEQN